MATYVLVHGAWHSGAAWDRVVPLLTDAGHRVLTPTLTGHGATRDQLTPSVGLDTYVDDIAAVLADLHDVILVGHSYAGMVVSGAANLVPERLAHLVYLDAMVPVHGETAVDVMPMIAGMLDGAGDSWRIPPLPVDFLGVTDPADVAWLSTMLTDEPALCYRQPVRMDNPALATVPRTHIHCVGGPQPDGARRRIPAADPLWTLDTGHDCMITAPAALAELLLKLA